MATDPKSLILGLLSTLRGGSMPVRALVAAGEVFGIQENGLRVALARLLADRRVQRDERGRYRLGPGDSATAALERQVAGWRRLEERVRPWAGAWLGVHLGRRKPPARAARAMRLLGFRSLEPGLEVRPDNRVGGADRVRDELASLGLHPEAAVFGIVGLDPARDLAARSLWDGHALTESYRASRRLLEESQERLPSLSEEEAMLESFVVGGRVIRQLVLDPLLPEPIVDTRERAALGRTLRAYDEVGRDCWVAFLDRFDVPHRRVRPATIADRDETTPGDTP